MTDEGLRAFGLIHIRLPSSNPRYLPPAVHLLLDGEGGVAPRQWSDLHPHPTGNLNGRTMWSLVLSPSGRKLLARVPVVPGCR